MAGSGEVIPPPYFITADDKRGLIVVTVALVLSFVWAVTFIRIWLRIHSRNWKSDDTLLAIATVLLTAQSGVIFHLVNLGLGASQDNIPSTQLEQLGKEGIASQIFYICTLVFSKCSVACLYLRLSPEGTHRFASYGVITASTFWAILSIILIVVPCNPAQYYISPADCKNRWAKWQAVGALDIATDIVLFGIAIQLVWNLQMRMKAKFIVVFAFSARLPVVAIAAVRLHFLDQRIGGQSDTFEYIVATQWQMGYAIMSSTISVMGPFLKPFKKEYTTSYHKESNDETQKSSIPHPSQNTRHSDTQIRDSWQSEGYLMQPIASRKGSRATSPDSAKEALGRDSSPIPESTTLLPSGTGSSRRSQTPHASNKLKADANFRPIDNVSRSNTEIWSGDPTASSGAEGEDCTGMREQSALVINKRTQFAVEVDQASPATPTRRMQRSREKRSVPRFAAALR